MRVSIYGAGQAGSAVAAILRARGVDVAGPFERHERERALRPSGGADVVVIATASFLAEIAPDVRAAVEGGANVLTTAEEAAYPWAASRAIADELDALAVEHRVSILGAGLNPGLAFDALVLTIAGAAPAVRALHVERVVDLSGFGAAVLRRIGIGHEPDDFADGVASGAITGHIGFPQSMRIAGAALGVTIERIERHIEAIVAEGEIAAAHMVVSAGRTAGFHQRYVAVAGDRPWFTASFTGHVDAARPTRDAIHVEADPPIDLELRPGLNAQSGSSAVLANSVRRLISAPPGWRTVADLPPAVPG